MAIRSDSGLPVGLSVLIVAILGILALPAIVVRGPRASGEAPSTQLPPLMDRDAVRAIDRGLTYLANSQRRDGSWSSTGSYDEYPEVMTALAGMALLANGSTPETGPYARQVTKAMDFLVALAKPDDPNADGLIASGGRSMYGHGFSTLFLAQCYGMELDQDTERRLHKVLTRAVGLIASSQSKLTSKFGKPCGGWYYTPGANSDEGSVTVTQLQALRACRNVGINVPKGTIEKAVEYLRHCQNPDGGICYSASSRGASTPAISSAAIACFYAAGVYDRQAGGGGPEAEMVEKLIAYVKKHVRPEDYSGGAWGHYFYMHFYLASAYYQRAGADWTDYYKAMKAQLIKTQNEGDGSWAGGVGVVFDTSVATMILQLPYGYMPIWQR